VLAVYRETADQVLTAYAETAAGNLEEEDGSTPKPRSSIYTLLTMRRSGEAARKLHAQLFSCLLSPVSLLAVAVPSKQDVARTVLKLCEL